MSNTQTPSEKLGVVTQPARITVSGQPTTPIKSPRVSSIKRWRTALNEGSQVAGYDPTNSPIKGRQDVEVLGEINGFVQAALNSLAQASDYASNGDNSSAIDRIAAANHNLDCVALLNEELRKRKAAKLIAGRLYRNH